MKALERYKQKYTTVDKAIPLFDYLEECKTNKDMYLNVAERLLKAIGDPVIINTKDDPVLGRLYNNTKLKTYPSISQNYLGQYGVIADVVSFLRNSARGLEASKQILYLLGPVGGGKSTLAELLKRLMEKEPFYALAIDKGNELVISPINENPLWLFNQSDEDDLQIPGHYLVGRHSPWASKRLLELEGDLSKFSVVKLYPDETRHIALAKTEPGDENNQDISTLVGKVDISQIGTKKQSDPDCYDYSGTLSKANRGIMEFVEMFKAPIKTLNPLLTATQEQNYNPTEQIASIPFEGIIVAHSNESEWNSFQGNKSNEAFLDRTYVIRVPYEMRKDNLIKIYEKELNKGALKNAPRDPHLLEVAAQIQLASILTYDSAEKERKDILTKIRVYNGENVKDEIPNTKSYQEYKELSDSTEGMDADISLRAMFKILSNTFDMADGEVSGNTIDFLLKVLQYIDEQYMVADPKTHDDLEGSLEIITNKYLNDIEDDLEAAYIGGRNKYGQMLFERYVKMADAWNEKNDYVDQDSGERFNEHMLDSHLSKVEKPAEISNPKDFRKEVVMYCLRYKAEHGKLPKWDDYSKIHTVLKKTLLVDFKKFIPVIVNNASISSEADKKKLDSFTENLKAKGYTDYMIRRVVNTWSRKRG